MSTPTRRRTLRSRLLQFITGGVDRLRQAWLLLTNAQNRLLNALATIPKNANGISRRLRTAITAFNTSLGAFNRTAMAAIERWAATELPLIYREGAHSLLDNADRPLTTFTWTPGHQGHVTALSAQFYADLTARITEGLRRARAFLRDAVAIARTRVRQADLTALRREHPLDTVVYANQSQHPVDAWARAAITWQAVTTANTAAARTSLDDLGVNYVEIRDGEGCGWRDHQDPDTANRTLRTIQDALAHPSAHPHCVRELLPRMDLLGRDDIISGTAL